LGGGSVAKHWRLLANFYPSNFWLIFSSFTVHFLVVHSPFSNLFARLNSFHYFLCPFVPATLCSLTYFSFVFLDLASLVEFSLLFYFSSYFAHFFKLTFFKHFIAKPRPNLCLFKKRISHPHILHSILHFSFNHFNNFLCGLICFWPLLALNLFAAIVYLCVKINFIGWTCVFIFVG